MWSRIRDSRSRIDLSLLLCCDTASGLFAQELSNYCDYCQPLKCWIEVSFARGSICSSLLLDFVSPSVWLDLYLHRRKRSGRRGIRQGTKSWLKLALVFGADSPKWAKDSVGFRVALDTWLSVGWQAFGCLIDVSSLVSCCLT